MFLLSSFLSSSLSLHCLLRAIGKFVSSFVLLLHHWFFLFFSFILFVCFLPLLEGHHCFIATMLFGFLMCPICLVVVATSAAAGPTTSHHHHCLHNEIGSALNFFNVINLFIFYNLYFLKFIVFLFLG